jgi:hypothetical protein
MSAPNHEARIVPASGWFMQVLLCDRTGRSRSISPQNQPLPRLLNLSLGIKPFPFRYQLRRAMQDHLEDAAILAGLSFSSCLLFGLLWLFLGPMGVAGTLAGYGLGLAIYLAPLPEQ